MSDNDHNGPEETFRDTERKLREQLKAARADAKENDALKAKLAKAVNCLWMAKEYIRDLESHEGAEGFSASTEILGKAYYATLAEIEGEK